MLAPEFTLKDDFPPVSYDEWRALAEADLEGAPFEQKLVTHTYEGIDVQPVYTRRDWPGEEDPFGFPGLPPFVRGSHPLGAVQTGWDLRQEHAHPDLSVTNRRSSRTSRVASPRCFSGSTSLPATAWTPTTRRPPTWPAATG